ncbi:MAG: helix-turn-helix domain-containing protein [Planctomycetota bacterium]
MTVEHQSKRRRLPADQRRQQLLDVALVLFAERGYARATTAELAKAAGVTEPVIYRHFASKRDLFVALIEQTAENTLRLWKTRLETTDDPAGRLDILLGANPMVAMGSEEASAYRIVLQSITETSDAVIREAINDHFTSLHAFIAAEVQRAQAARQVSGRLPPAMIAWVLIDIALGFGVLSAMGVSGHNREADETGSTSDLIRQILLPRKR